LAATREGEEGRARVEVVDVELALAKVQSLITLLEQSQRLSAASPGFAVSPQQREIDNQILEQLPLVQRIAARIDPELAAKIRKDESSYGWTFYKAADACRQLVGLLNSADEEKRILGPVGPKLAAASLHPWV
jgi:hypothetical protein